MIDTRTFTPEWLNQKKLEFSRDPSIMESMMLALYLLEQLQLSGLSFIFKGGTSLILLLDSPQRFSVDIDIIVSPAISQEDLEEYLQKTLNTGIFHGIRLDEHRSYRKGVPKAHYAFSYTSKTPGLNRQNEVVAQPEREILLDILFADPHYPRIVEKAIKTPWLVLTGKDVTIRMPDVNSITGDKLTAFAPQTTGVPYHRISKQVDGQLGSAHPMFMEIIKQAFDIGCLFDMVDDLNILREAFLANAVAEIAYRADREIGLPAVVLNDIIATSLIIARGSFQINDHGKEHFGYLKTGIQQFRNYVYTHNFRIEEAQVATAKAHIWLRCY